MFCDKTCRFAETIVASIESRFFNSKPLVYNIIYRSQKAVLCKMVGTWFLVLCFLGSFVEQRRQVIESKIARKTPPAWTLRSAMCRWTNRPVGVVTSNPHHHSVHHSTKTRCFFRPWESIEQITREIQSQTIPIMIVSTRFWNRVYQTIIHGTMEYHNDISSSSSIIPNNEKQKGSIGPHH